MARIQLQGDGKIS